MILAQEFGVGQVIWSLLWFTLFVIWIFIVIRVFMDIFRARDMSGWGKAGWAVGIIILPFLGVFMYLIVNGNKMHQRDAEDAEAADQAAQAYIRDAARSDTSSADQLSKLADLHSAGSLSDDEYEQAKAQVFQS